MRFDPKSLLSDERGLSTVEYIIVLALLAIAALTAWQLFGDSLVGAAEGSADTLETLDSSSGGSGGGAGSGDGAGGGSAGGGAGAAGASGGASANIGGGGSMESGSRAGSSIGGGGTVVTSSGASGTASSMGRGGGGGGGGEDDLPENGEGEAGIYVAPGTDEEEFDPFGFGAVMSVFFALAIPLMVMLKKARGGGGE